MYNCTYSYLFYNLELCRAYIDGLDRVKRRFEGLAVEDRGASDCVLQQILQEEEGEKIEQLLQVFLSLSICLSLFLSIYLSIFLLVFLSLSFSHCRMGISGK